MEETGQKKTITNASRFRQSDGTIEIDLLELSKEMLRHWVAILLITVLGGVIAFCYSRFFITPQYESTATMYILTKETTLASLADLQIGTQLTNDYQVVVTNRTVLEHTIDALGLGDSLTYGTLKGKIKTDNPSNTRMLQITATHPDPKLAMDIANTVAEKASDFIADMMEITPPKVIEKAVLPTQKASPSNGRNAAIGALIGFLLAAAYITVRQILNDAVKSEEDVEKYLQLTVLASLPDRSEGKAGKREDDRREKLKQSRKKRSMWDQIQKR